MHTRTRTRTRTHTHTSEKWDYERVLAEQKPVASENRGARWLKHAPFHAHKTRLSVVTARSVCAQMKAKKRKPIDNELEPFVAAARFLPTTSIHSPAIHTFICQGSNVKFICQGSSAPVSDGERYDARRRACCNHPLGRIQGADIACTHPPARPPARPQQPTRRARAQTVSYDANVTRTGLAGLWIGNRSEQEKRQG